MPETRQDPLLGHWVIMAPERADRPFEHVPPAVRRPLEICPFCRGNERETPDAVLTVPADPSGAVTDMWAVRVIPNRYPALRPDTCCVEMSSLGTREPGIGRHEVIIESPTHETDITQFDADQLTRVLKAYVARARAIRDEGVCRHISIFKNSGPAAGASLEHVHSQLLATPFISQAVTARIVAAERAISLGHGCPWCRLLDAELAAGHRSVVATDDWAVLCPWASRFAAEMCIFPRCHMAHFEDMSDTLCGSLAVILQSCLRRLSALFTAVPYNLVIQTAPWHQTSNGFHWHLEILPRINGLAGFEVGAGNWINTLLPEDAANRLRSAPV